MVDFYVEVLGFHVTDRGEPMPGMGEMVFISQSAQEHHQIVLVHTPDAPPPGVMFADHLAFHVDSLDELREVADRLVAAGNTTGVPVSHGNAWSVYFTDPEGNGLECFVDSPFHVAQPYGGGLDLSRPDADIERHTRSTLESQPDFQPFDEWRAAMAARLAGHG
jgi:catechol 2,3-dioxygenase